jgi:hypothetical protein
MIDWPQANRSFLMFKIARKKPVSKHIFGDKYTYRKKTAQMSGPPLLFHLIYVDVVFKLMVTWWQSQMGETT